MILDRLLGNTGGTKADFSPLIEHERNSSRWGDLH